MVHDLALTILWIWVAVGTLELRDIHKELKRANDREDKK